MLQAGYRALFKLTRSWKQSNCPLAEELLSKLEYIGTMAHHSTQLFGRMNVNVLVGEGEFPQCIIAKREKQEAERCVISHFYKATTEFCVRV